MKNTSKILASISIILSCIVIMRIYHQQESIKKDIPYQKSVDLGNNTDTLDWFVDEGVLYIYTKQDSINDEIERWNYIKSINPEGWEE